MAVARCWSQRVLLAELELGEPPDCQLDVVGSSKPCSSRPVAGPRAGVAVEPLLPLLSALPTAVFGILLRRAIIIWKKHSSVCQCLSLSDSTKLAELLSPQTRLQ